MTDWDCNPRDIQEYESRNNEEYADDYICWNSPTAKDKHNILFVVVEIVGIKGGYCDIVYHTGVRKDTHTAYNVPVSQLEIIKESDYDQ